MIQSRARFCSQNEISHYDQVLKPTYWLLPKRTADAPIREFGHYSLKSTLNVTRLVDNNILLLYSLEMVHFTGEQDNEVLIFNSAHHVNGGYTKLGEFSATYKIQKFNLIYLFWQLHPSYFSDDVTIHTSHMLLVFRDYCYSQQDSPRIHLSIDHVLRILKTADLQSLFPIFETEDRIILQVFTTNKQA